MISKKNFIIVIFILIILISIILYFDLNKNKICFDKNCFKVEIAKTMQERQEGLMFRKSLDKDSGMLFLFPEEDYYSFWMKNTSIPLDIIWIDLNKKIVYMKENAQPCFEEFCESFKPNKKSLYVLELNSGEIKKYNLKINDKATIYL